MIPANMSRRVWAIGHYNVTAKATGFKVEEKKGIVLNVGDRTRVDFTMTVGAIQEHVTVEAAAVAVQSDSGEVSSVITGQQVSQLATNGRSMYTLVRSDARGVQHAGRLSLLQRRLAATAMSASTANGPATTFRFSMAAKTSTAAAAAAASCLPPTLSRNSAT